MPPINYDLVRKLRNRQTVRFFDRNNKIFIAFCINRNEKCSVFWEKHVSLDKRNWVKQNEYLSLKDVLRIVDRINVN